ncbi:MlaD family protein [Amycolatopsis methanolica]|uniref:Mammalian cell entry related domain-containing protein n=1 Tax=Amycolatopsis methanolica 239 TaxID=1068978 RepID=A0A076N0H2_AMYME|nr:MlaD family protein [Amycolatopsis methanolica]AIJ23307.1 Mammalian cell entry related domain-containing protein [Amycolatopsis methanolica 239]
MNLRSSPARLRLTLVLAFVLACVVFLAFLLAQAGAKVPLMSGSRDYRVSVRVADVDNLVPFSDVRIAGIDCGKVAALTREGDQIRLDLELNSTAAPLHEGVTVQVSEKSLAGQSYLRLVDGAGAELPSGTTLPASAVKPSVQLHDVLASLDQPTRDALGATLRSLGQATQGSANDISRTMIGLAELGRDGHTALDAIAAQSEDLKALMTQSTTLLDALDTGQGEIASLVSDASRLTQATSAQRQAVEDALRQLPGVLDSTQLAADRFRTISGSLAPVAADLKQAAPDLNTALLTLPAATRDLRGLLPSLGVTLDRAPATLQRIPTAGGDLRALAPTVRSVLRDVNPMLRYLEPYGRDISAFFAGFNAVWAYKAEDGLTVLRLAAVNLTSQVLKTGLPLPTDVGPLRKSNPYPLPGMSATPTFNAGPYPRVEQDPQ